LNYRLEDIPEEGVGVQGECDRHWLEQSFRDHQWPEMWFITPASYTMRLSRTGSLIAVSGSLDVTVEMQCSRCLEKNAFLLDPEFEFVLAPATAKNLPHEIELQKEELNTEFYKGETIDLLEIVRNQIILTVPFKPLCSPACKGICPKCGKNKNKESCECVDEGTVDPRFVALQKISKKEQT
jgi:uncharacterized protein